MTDSTPAAPGGIHGSGPVATGGGQVNISAPGGVAAGRDVRIETFHQYVVETPARSRRPRPGGLRPYPGLRPFDEDRAHLFHGRERETEQVLSLLAAHPVSAVVGSSGSGKSSLLAAGVAHALRQGGLPGSGRWAVRLLGGGPLPVEQLCAALRAAFEDAGVAYGPLPGPHALRADPALFGRLSARLATSTGERVVWLLDQFESYLSPAQPPATLRCVAGAVLSVREHGAGSVHVLVALRTDLYQRLEADADLAAEVSGHQFWLPPLTREGLRDAVRGPAEAAGLDVQEELTDRIVADAAAGPGSLPLIAYALEQVWERDDARELTLAAYEATGGVAAALERGAQRAWDALDAPGQAVARRVLVRLAHVGGGERATRRVAFARDLVTDVDSEQAVLAVVDSFVRERLLLVGRNLVDGEATVEVAHEVLLEKWPALRQWLADEPRAKQVQDDIAAGTAQWLEHGRDEGFLLPTGRLLLWERLDPARWPLNEREVAYVEASRRARARVRRDRERARVLQRRWVVTGICLVLALAVAASAFWVQQRTARARTVTEALRLSAQARSAMGERRDVAELLAAAAVHTNDAAATRSALVDVLGRQGGQLAVHRPRFGAARPNTLTALPAAGGVLVLGCSDGSLRRVDPVSGAERGVFGERNGDAVSAVAVADGLLVSGDETGGVVVQPTTVGAGVTARLRAPGGVRIAAVALDARRGVVLAGGVDGVVARWLVRDGRVSPLRSVRLAGAVTAIAVHRPGSLAAVTTSAGHVQEISTDPARAGVVSDTMVNAPGAGAVADTAVAGGGLAVVDGVQLHLWDRPGAPPRTGAAPRTTAVVAARQTVFTGDSTGRVRVWTGPGVPRPTGEALVGPPADAVVALATDGTLLSALTRERRLVVWDLGGRRSPAAVARAASVGGKATAVSYGPAGTLALGDSTGTVRFAGSGPYSGARMSLSRAPVTGLAWTGRASLVAGTADGVLHGVDLTTFTHKPLAVRPSSPVKDVRSAPDGTVAAAWDDQVLIHRPDGSTVRLPGSTGGGIHALALGPHGEIALSVGAPTVARVLLWPRGIATRAPVLLRGHRLFVAALAFSPDGGTLATGSDDRTVALWDVRSARRVGTLTGHGDTVRALAWSGGHLLASAAEDGTVRLWDTRSATGHGMGPPLRYAEDDEVTALSASPDGLELTAANGHYAVTWPFAPEAWTWRACALTAELRGDDQEQSVITGYADGTYPMDVCPKS
ncbi:nSTAND1 domain-containing NTPase [Streptomyces sp. NPDC001443]